MSATQPSQPWAPGQPVSAARLEQLRANAIMEVRGVEGRVKVTRHGNSATVDVIDRPAVIGQRDFVARINGSATQDGSNLRWYYPFVEVVQTAVNYGGWTDKVGGRTGTLMNLNEDQNGATGTFGNGIAFANLTGTFTLKPIPSGTRVRVWTENVGGTVQYWCEIPNGVDGACE